MERWWDKRYDRGALEALYGDLGANALVRTVEMGKPHEAVTWLKLVAEGGMPNYPLFHENPSMSKLHGNPEYEQFMVHLKLRWNQLVAGL